MQSVHLGPGPGSERQMVQSTEVTPPHYFCKFRPE